MNPIHICASADGRWAIVAGHETLDATKRRGCIWQLDLKNGTQSRLEIAENEFETVKIAFSGDGKTLIVATQENSRVRLRKWERRNDSWTVPVKSDLANLRRLGEIACSRTGDLLAISGRSGVVLIKTADLTTVETLRLRGSNNSTLEFMDPNGRLTYFVRGRSEAEEAWVELLKGGDKRFNENQKEIIACAREIRRIWIFCRNR